MYKYKQFNIRCSFISIEIIMTLSLNIIMNGPGRWVDTGDDNPLELYLKCTWAKLWANGTVSPSNMVDENPGGIWGSHLGLFTAMNACFQVFSL